jgi:hypothetical protein
MATTRSSIRQLLATRHRSLLTGCLAAILAASAGCRQDEAPPPRMAFDGDVKVAPVRASEIVPDTTLLQAAATAEEAAKPVAGKPGAGEAAAIVVDDATPEGLAKAYAEIMSTGQIMQLPGIVVPDQKDAVEAAVKAIAPLAQAMSELRKVWTEKFPQQPVQLPPSVGDGAKYTVAGVEADATNANLATATFQREGTEKAATRKLQKVNEKWRIEETEMPPAEALPLLEGQAAAVKGITEQISGGQLADAAAAGQALVQAMTSAAAGGAAPAAGAAGTAEQPPAGAQPAPAPKDGATAAPKKERDKSELEQDVDNAAGRSVLGGGL